MIIPKIFASSFLLYEEYFLCYNFSLLLDLDLPFNNFLLILLCNRVADSQGYIVNDKSVDDSVTVKT